MSKSIYETVVAQFKLNLDGDHGILHWKRTQKIGLYLSKGQKVDTEVIRLFALLHDSQRADELNDSGHGARASKFAKALYDMKMLKISSQQLKQLQYACRYHSDRDAKTDDPTIKICWDSDRLDLFRLLVQPDPSRLLTEMAKRPESIRFAQGLPSIAR